MATTAESVKVDPKDPNVRRMVYNMYRGILGNYNDKANDIISAIPKDRVVEDQGITRQLESMIRQQSQISGGGNSPSATAYHDSAVPPAPPPPPPMSQGGAPPPPPPPPPLGLVHIPNMRLKTEISDVRREPPAAIQNAMMTKDKKPFTYTPGGLDLSEIRSPRMQRRINRNAQAEDAAATTNGVDRPAGQPRPLSMPPGSGAMPQMAVPVFPQAVVGSGHAPHPPPPPLPPAPPQQQWSPQSAPSPQQMAVPKMQPVQRQVTASPVQNTGSIYVPPVQTQPQPPRSQLGSLYVPPVANNRPAQQESTSYSPSPVPYSPPTPQLNKSPAPWMSRNNQAQQQAKDQVPPWVVNRETAVQSPSSPIASAPTFNSNNSYGQQQTQSQPQTRIIPIQIEGHETPQSNTRIVPIQMEGSPSPQHNAPQFNYQQQQPQQQQLQQRRPVYVHNKNNSQFVNPNNNSTVDGRSPQGWVSQSDDTASSTPVQSRSFRVLQKITDANNPGEDMPYNSQGVPLSQLRKLQLSDDDRALMNKVKTQVDEEQFLHNESDPRYRGASIPSRAFRMLQNMTEHPGDYMAQVPQGSGSTHVLTNRRPQPQEPTPPPPQPYIPPSEQQVQEPRKYQGGAIPSRSFRILQAMTASSNRPGRPDESEY